jgi:methyl-accepting chemotaxis protein
MAIQKTRTSRTDTAKATTGDVVKKEADEKRRRARTLARQQQAAESISSSSRELGAGIGEASEARTELEKSMELISTGSEESSAAAQESLTAMEQISANLEAQGKAAEFSSGKTLTLQGLVDGVSNNINNLVTNVRQAAEDQSVSAGKMTELESVAAQINESVNHVMRIADQTNLLALNAAIEAGRAGKHGKGFAVVADTVRALAESSETNAGQIGELIEKIQTMAQKIGSDVKDSADTAKNEAEKGIIVNEQLSIIKTDLSEIYDGALFLGKGALEMIAASEQTRKGSSSIAAAAEQQSAACEESMKTLEQQGQALANAEDLSAVLEELAEELKNSTDIAKSSEEVAASSEELSATIEEINRASTEINKAIYEISKGADTAASAAEESASGVAQIEKGVVLAEERAGIAVSKGEAITELLTTNKDAVDSMIRGINDAMEAGRANLVNIAELEDISRKIDKIVDAISNVAIKISMLAVNGAIEAARAGEYGKGFAVVSADIQNLADDAAENAEQIKDLVKNIQDQAVFVRNDLSSVSDSTLAEVAKAKTSTDDLETIESDMMEVVKGNREVLIGCKEVIDLVDLAKTGIDQIAIAAEQATSSAEKAGIAAGQQSNGAAELAKAIEEIASTADELQSAI